MSERSENSLNIAFATTNQTDLDQHFGSCQSLVIYSLTPDSYEQLQCIEFPYCEGHNQQKINDRLAALSDCFAVYCLACGNPVRKQLLAQGTRVVIKSKEQPISELVQQIQSNWPGKIALRQQRQNSRKQDTDYLAQLADSEFRPRSNCGARTTTGWCDARSSTRCRGWRASTTMSSSTFLRRRAF